MTARDFAYWCQGYFEIGGDSVKTLDENQVQIIKNHLNMVFLHDIDPKMGSKEHQAKLDALHDGGTIVIGPTKPSFPPKFPVEGEYIPDEFKGGIHGDIRMRC